MPPSRLAADLAHPTVLWTAGPQGARALAEAWAKYAAEHPSPGARRNASWWRDEAKRLERKIAEVKGR